MTINPLVPTLEDIIQPVVDLKVDDGKHNKQISNLVVLFISTDDAQQFQQLKRELCVKIIEEANTLAIGAQGWDNSPIILTMRDKNVDTWRSVLPNAYAWYASYRSNMWKPRFLFYIEGGQAECIATYSSGSKDI
eukprot:Gb_35900 [translate_table: standard]